MACECSRTNQFCIPIFSIIISKRYKKVNIYWQKIKKRRKKHEKNKKNHKKTAKEG